MPGPIQQAQPVQPQVMSEVAPPGAPPTVNLPAGSTSEPAIPIAEKVIGAGTTVATNMATASWAGPEVNGLAGLVNLCAEYLKNRPWFPEGWLLVPFVIVVSLAIGWGLWHDNIVEAVSKGAWIATQAHTNFAAGKRIGLLAPTAPENKFHGGLNAQA